MKSTLKTLVALLLTTTLMVVGWTAQAAAVETGTSPATTVTLPSDTTATTDDRSLFEKVSDFASDNATWFIIGIIAIAVILAAIFILRGRKKGPSGPSGATPKPSAPKPGQDAPSAAEIKRRRRAAMQRAREEERLRRKAGLPAGAKPAQALDPVAAEKHAAKTGAPQQSRAPVPPSSPVSPEAPTEVSPGPGGIGAGAAAGGLAAAAAGAAAAGAIGGSRQEDDAEARLREKVEEIKAGQSAVAPSPEARKSPEAPTGVSPAPGGIGTGAVAGGVAAAAAGAAAAGSLGGRDEAAGTPGDIAVPADLAEAESRIRSDREARDRTLQEAEQRLRLVEERAAAAERRAAFAEQLAELKAEEGEQERRLREVLERMDRAEERARQAELRAESAERVASDALRGRSAQSSAPLPPAGQPAAPAAPSPEAASSFPAAPPSSAAIGAVNINTASFEELRGAEFSVTQATRVLAYRERFGGYSSVDDLARVPGFSPETIAAIRDRISI